MRLYARGHLLLCLLCFKQKEKTVRALTASVSDSTAGISLEEVQAQSSDPTSVRQSLFQIPYAPHTHTGAQDRQKLTPLKLRQTYVGHTRPSAKGVPAHPIMQGAPAWWISNTGSRL